MKLAYLIYRKPRSSGNYSIEASFDQMLAAFPENADIQPEKFTSSHLSSGLISRIRSIHEVSRLNADVYHITGDVHYLTLGLLGKKTILTIHDLGFLNDYKGLKRSIIKYFWLTLPIKRAKFVTVVSKATYNELIQNTNIPAENIVIIPTIIKSHFQISPPKPFPKKPTILHVGTAPNKNLNRHILAIKRLGCHLSIIGNINDEHKKLLNDNKISYNQRYNLTDLEMRQAYEDADLLLFASTLEGFGMPILEAQSVGRPVITSNCSSMPEVAGEGACLVDPFDVDSIRAGVERVLHEEDYRQQLVGKGLENVRRFQPERIAQQYLSLYQQILENAKN